MDNGLILAALATAIGTAVLVAGLLLYFNRRKLTDEKALRNRLDDLAVGQQNRSSADSISILRKTVESKSVIDRLLSGRQIAAGLEEDTRLSGTGMSAGQLVGFALSGAMLGVLSAFFIDKFAAIAVGLAGAVAPFIVVANRTAARVRQIEEQLPDAVDMLVNSLRAGYSLQAGMHFVGTEMPAPVGVEFNRFYDEHRLGMDVRQALQGLTDRLGTLDGRMFVLAIIIQRETGGNLSEILGNIASVIRDRINFRGQLDVLTAEAKLSAVVLTFLPVVMYAVIRISNPEYMKPLTQTDTGKLMLLYAVVSLAIGYVVLRKMSKIEV